MSESPLRSSAARRSSASMRTEILREIGLLSQALAVRGDGGWAAAANRRRSSEGSCMNSIRNVCVYCGSSEGDDARFGEAADALGRILAAEEIGLVYGGGGDGLMGRLARGDARRRRLRHRDYPQFSRAQGTRADRRAGNAGRREHARAQAGDVRPRRRVRRAARRNRHARGTRRADDVGAARPPRQADPDRGRHGLLAAAARPLRPHERSAASFVAASSCAISWRRRSRMSCRCCARPSKRPIASPSAASVRNVRRSARVRAPVAGESAASDVAIARIGELIDPRWKRHLAEGARRSWQGFGLSG